MGDGMFEPGALYRLTLSNSYLPPRTLGRFVGWQNQHCQLHGEFMYRGAEFRKVTEAGREKHSFIVDPKNIVVADRLP